MWLQLGLVALCYIIYLAASSFIKARQFKAFAESRGCQEPYLLVDHFPYGVRRIRRILNLKKSGEDFLDDIIRADFEHAATIQWKGFDGSLLTSTVEPANLQAMLATQFNDFETGERRYQCLKPVIGRSIFSSDGAFWEHSRALFRPQFARENINDLEATEHAASKFVEAIGPSNVDGWTAVTDVLPLLYNFTLDTATDFLFGQSVESQQIAINAKSGSKVDPSAEDRAANAKAFTDAFGVMNETLVMRIRVQALYWLVDSLAFRRAMKTIKGFTAPIVQRAIDTAQSSAKREEKKQSLLANLATQTQDKAELGNQTLAILLAGRDTTSALLGWAILRLALHQDIFAKLRNVVLQEIEPGTDITFAKLKGCRYLQHFLNEVLRLHPTVPMNLRVASKDTTLPVGGGPDQRSPIALKKGQTIIFSTYVLHRRQELWGEDVLEFKPERWEKRFQAWQFLPFLGGPRICLGQQFALVEASYLIVRLLHEFNAIEIGDPNERHFRKGLGLTMSPGNGVKVRLRRA